MIKGLLLSFFILCSTQPWGQGGTPQTVNKLPDFIPPTPEVASLVKADNITVGYSTGSPNIAIPLGELTVGSYRLPIGLGYSSTGVKTDEYASMVGMGWNLDYGGVVTRVVYDKPDEYRTIGNSNLNAPNLLLKTQAAWNFLTQAADKESDVFTFTFPGGSGKFILDASNVPIQLSKQNLVIKVINSNFQNGFTITTDDGTIYQFADAEISTSRNPSGTNCEKTFDNLSVKTSWYLTKITLPSLRKFINFTYTTANITFESSVSQTVSKVVSTTNYACTAQTGGPTGPACVVGSERFSTCISAQVVTTKFITSIQTSDGDKVTFTYDGTARQDLNSGKRLSSLSFTNRDGSPIRHIVLNTSYQTAVAGNYAVAGGFQNKRLFLEDIEIRQSTQAATAERMRYSFQYINYSSLPYRLSYAQDMYGYYNGKNSNASLIPVLPSTDINYSSYSSGTGGVSVTFGNRAIDTLYSTRGMLNRIVYPTGGYDSISYIANKTIVVVSGSETEQLAGGHSVAAINSYTDLGLLAARKVFLYRNKSDNKLSSFLLTKNLVFSQRDLTKRDGYSCPGDEGHSPMYYCEGPSCEYAVVTSNVVLPITAFGSQHLYFRSVMELMEGNGTNNGLTEHKYKYFNGGTTLTAEHIMGDPVISAPFHILPDFLIGETQTTMFRRNGATYDSLKSTRRNFVMEGLTQVYNYVVKRTYLVTCEYSPPSSMEFDPFNVDRYYINFFTLRNDSTEERTFSDVGGIQKSLTVMTYGNTAYTYPTSVKTWGSDGLEQRIDRKYPQDFGSGYEKLLYRNMVGQLVEEKTYNNNILQVTKTNTYQDWFSDTTVITPSLINLKIQANTLTQKVNFYSYDLYGNITELAKENGERISYIWDYDNQYAVAKVQNSSPSQIAYSSFESSGKGNWMYGGTPLQVVKAPTGRKAYPLSAVAPISKSGLTSGSTYIVSYWTKNASAYTIAGTISGYPIVGKTISGWKYFEHKITGQTTITITGSGQIDEVRLYPVSALMTSFTYSPMVGLRSQCDVNNRISYYFYDGLNRLILITDEDRNVLKKYCYSYAGDGAQCTFYLNDEMTQSYQKNDCPQYYGGSSVPYTVPYGMYVSTISKVNANALAQAEMDANGVTNANAKGYCYLLCSTPPCTGPTMKCVNARCESGVKVITSSVQQGAHLWECTYHYEWSDGSWSINYTEQSPTPCSLGGED